MKYILAIDQGTTGTTTILIDINSLNVIDKVSTEFTQIYPSPGMVEHDLDEIWKTVRSTTNELIKKNNISTQDIECIGITNQRETTCAFNKAGQALSNAIVWQDRRTTSFCQELKDQGKEDFVTLTTGLPIDPYFSASKMNWLLNNSKKVQQAALQSDLRFGTIDTYLLYKLTDGLSFATEPSNASRTLLMNLSDCCWNDELLKIFNLERSFLPEIKNSFCIFGKTANLDFLPDGIPITGILGDQQSALIGQAGTQTGDIKCTFGTGAFIVMNTGEKICRSSAGLLSTVLYKSDTETIYALEGSCYIAGAAVQWLRDNLNLIEASPQIESLANNIQDLKEMEHLLFLPFFTGMGSPYWNPYAKAAIIGITRDTNNSHLARACLDGIALSINDLLSIMKNEANINFSSLKVDGGAVSNDLLMTIQATVSEIEMIRPRIIETTSYGAAIAAAIGNKTFSLNDIKTLWKCDRVFTKNESETKYYKSKKENWEKAIKRLYSN